MATLRTLVAVAILALFVLSVVPAGFAYPNREEMNAEQQEEYQNVVNSQYGGDEIVAEAAYEQNYGQENAGMGEQNAQVSRDDAEGSEAEDGQLQEDMQLQERMERALSAEERARLNFLKRTAERSEEEQLEYDQLKEKMQAGLSDDELNRADRLKKKYEAQQRGDELREQAQLLKKKYEEAREQFLKAKDEYLEKKREYYGHRQQLYEARDEADQCDQGVEDCEGKKQELRDVVKHHLERAVEVIKSSIGKTESKVDESRLTDKEKQRFHEQLDSYSQKLADIAADLQELETPTAEEIREEMHALKDIWQGVRTIQKEIVHALREVKSGHILDQLEVLGDRMEARIAQEEESGRAAEARELLAEYREQLVTLEERYLTMKEEGTKESFEEFREGVHEAKMTLREALQALHEAPAEETVGEMEEEREEERAPLQQDGLQ